MPPLVPQLRKKVKEWRDSGYVGATDTSRSLLNWWFKTPHLMPQADGTMAEFQYYFAQREALETIVYLYDVVGVQDKFDLMRFDSSGAVSAGMFDETWRRFVVKDGDRLGQDQGAEPGAGVELFPQAVRAGVGTGAQLPGDRAQHHRAGPHLQGFSGPAHLLEDDPVLPGQRRGRAQLARRFSTDAACAGRGAHHPPDRQHLPDQHPPRLCGRRHSRFARRRRHDGLFPRQAAERRDHRLQGGPWA